MFGVTALYCRLSVADNCKKEESDSISNQREYIWNYVKENMPEESRNCKEFIDDGYSGADFERPAVQSLLEMAGRHEVRCIIVKDFSRFGRNYIAVGNYIEKIFPCLGIRFISVNDGYDSGIVSAGLDVAFKNIMHDYYRKEASYKAVISRRQQIEKGRAVMARPPYGYWKSKNQKGMLMVDQESADIVKEIFALYLEGVSSYQIACILNERGVPSPNQRLEKYGLVHFEKIDADKIRWSCGSVLYILKNPVVTGNMAGNKCVKNQGGKRKWKRLEQNDWILVENTHEAIISENDFQKAQIRLAQRKRKKKT